MKSFVRRVLLLVFCLAVAQPVWAQAPVTYRVSFPEPEHHWMQVEGVFSDLGSAPLQARMSRSSPGRYALHEFAKNVYDVKAFDASGTALTIDRPTPHQWNVMGHQGRVRMTYRVFGDRTDGTFLGIDSTHAHINMPAALMWARGLEGRPARITFESPARAAW
jgi:predicted metalloprotease with PDZ domain